MKIYEVYDADTDEEDEETEDLSAEYEEPDDDFDE